MVIDVLRGVGLAVRKKAASGNADVLHEDGIDRHGRVARIRHLQVPGPRRLFVVQSQCRAVADAARIPFPDHAIFGNAEPNSSARANGLGDQRRRAADAQEDTRNAALDRRCQHLIDENRAVFGPMLDREH